MSNHVESGDKNTATHGLVFGIASEPTKKKALAALIFPPILRNVNSKPVSSN
jgi:hypothetical protein